MAVTITETEYVTIGGLACGSRAIWTKDYMGLFGGRMKGDDLPAPGATGVQDRTRQLDALRTQITVRLDGRYGHDTDNASTGTTVAQWRTGLTTSYALLKAVGEVTAVQTFSLTFPGGPYTADCQVEDWSTFVQVNAWTWDVVLDLTFPDGPLV